MCKFFHKIFHGLRRDVACPPYEINKNNVAPPLPASKLAGRGKGEGQARGMRRAAVGRTLAMPAASEAKRG